MRSSDSLYHFAENGWTAEAQSHGDPIFTPLFTAIIGSATIGVTSITYASVAAAIAAGGDFWEFSP